MTYVASSLDEGINTGTPVVRNPVCLWSSGVGWLSRGAAGRGKNEYQSPNLNINLQVFIIGSREIKIRIDNDYHNLELIGI